jgi:hypothetical protein
MPLADEHDLDVAEAKTESFDALLDRWYGRLEIAVDEDVSPGGSDQVRCQFFAAHVIEIARNAVGRERLGPGRVLRGELYRKSKGSK